MNRIPPIAAIAASVTAIIGLGFGATLFRWEMFGWLATVIGFSLTLLMAQRTNDLHRQTIGFQARIIRSQGELLARMAAEENDGRE